MRFLDLIKPQVGMFFYVDRQRAGSNDPNAVVQLAKQYVREHGHETKAMEDFLDAKLRDLGVATNLNKSVSESAPDLSAGAADVKPIEVSARFLAKDTQLSMQDCVYRFNDIEQQLRDLAAGKDPRERFRKSRDDDRKSSRGRSNRNTFSSRSENRYDRGREDKRDKRKHSDFTLERTSRRRDEKKSKSKPEPQEEDKSAKRKSRFEDEYVIRVHRREDLSETGSEADTSASTNAESDSQE
jgi:hypothetical protein